MTLLSPLSLQLRSHFMHGKFISGLLISNRSIIRAAYASFCVVTALAGSLMEPGLERLNTQREKSGPGELWGQDTYPPARSAVNTYAVTASSNRGLEV